MSEEKIRHHESIVICRENLTESQINEIYYDYIQYFKENTLELEDSQNLGKKKLAYQIGENKQGYYLTFEFFNKIDSNFLSELEKKYREDTNVLKYITLSTEKEYVKEKEFNLKETNFYKYFHQELQNMVESQSSSKEYNLNKLTEEDVDEITEKLLDDDYFNQNVNEYLMTKLQEKAKEKQTVEEKIRKNHIKEISPDEVERLLDKFNNKEEFTTDELQNFICNDGEIYLSISNLEGQMYIDEHESLEKCLNYIENNQEEEEESL